MLRASKFAFFAATVVVACAIDDRTLKETDGETGGGSGGRGGSTGGKATGGSDTGGKATGGSDTGGKATGGTAGGGTGTGGSAGKAGSGGFGAAEDCNGEPLAIDEDVVRACLMQTGCSPFLPVVGLSSCITNQRLRTFSEEDCGTGAQSCDGFLDCIGFGYLPTADCSSGEAHCEGELAVSCGRRATAVNCTTRGGTCGTYTDTSGTLRAGCHHEELANCIDPSEVSQCGATDIAYTCYDGFAYGVDCGEIGAECQAGSCYFVLPTCATPGATCGTTTRLDQCYSNNDLARYECAPGLGCEEDDTSTAECRAPGCTDIEPCTESCDGTEVTFCYGRVPVTIDCTDFGFTKCYESVLNEGEDPVAYCGVPEGTPDLICELDDADTICGACIKIGCCAEWTACADHPDCLDFIDCGTACAGVSTCIDDCELMHPAGLATYNDYVDCRSAGCAVECAG